MRLEPEFNLEFGEQRGGCSKSKRHRNWGNCYDYRECLLSQSQDAGGLLCEPTPVPTALSTGLCLSLGMSPTRSIRVQGCSAGEDGRYISH